MAGNTIVVQKPRSSWPGLSEETAQEFVRIGQGLPVSNPNVYLQKSVREFAIQDYATTGHNVLTFFSNQQEQEHICTLNGGEIPTEAPIWLTGVCVTFQDLTQAGARSGAQASSSAITSLDRAEQIRSILQAGTLELYQSERLLLGPVQDLTHFPSDGGFHTDAAGISFAAATASSFVFHNNGIPLSGNSFKLKRPLPLLPSKKVKVLLKWQQLLTITTAGRIKVELVGEQVKPSNV